ncbi:MAG: YqhA family protein [Oligoflexus sp.]
MSSTKPNDQQNQSNTMINAKVHFFESLLWGSRFLVLLAIIPSLIGALTLFIIATLDIFKLVSNTLEYYTSQTKEDFHDTVVTNIIVAVDMYLIAIVLLIFGLGVYKLFISKIEMAEDVNMKHPFNIRSFDQLKDKIARVVILAVIIEFFRAVVGINFDSPLDAIYLALSVLALALSLYLMKISEKSD